MMNPGMMPCRQKIKICCLNEAKTRKMRKSGLIKVEILKDEFTMAVKDYRSIYDSLPEYFIVKRDNEEEYYIVKEGVI